jgi:hypothetical protein
MVRWESATGRRTRGYFFPAPQLRSPSIVDQKVGPGAAPLTGSLAPPCLGFLSLRPERLWSLAMIILLLSAKAGTFQAFPNMDEKSSIPGPPKMATLGAAENDRAPAARDPEFA